MELPARGGNIMDVFPTFFLQFSSFALSGKYQGRVWWKLWKEESHIFPAWEMLLSAHWITKLQLLI